MTMPAHSRVGSSDHFYRGCLLLMTIVMFNVLVTLMLIRVKGREMIG
jgi:hypothetical protein